MRTTGRPGARRAESGPSGTLVGVRAPRRPRTRPVVHLARAVTAVALVIGVGIVSPVLSSSEPDRADASDALGAGGEFHPLPPQRVLDTRSGTNIAAGARALVPDEGSVFQVPLSGRGGLPAMGEGHDVLGIAASITVVDPTQPGYLSAFGTGGPEGTSSIVNFGTGENVPNMAILAPGDGGSVSVRLVSQGAAGTAHVLIDVFGWFSTSDHPEQGSRLIPVGPGRIFDSRQAAFGATPIAGGSATRVQVRGATSLDPRQENIVPPDADVTGALLNITAVNQGPQSASTFVSVLPVEPAPGAPPTTSNLNLRRDHVMANLVLTPVGPDGSIWLYNSAGDTHLIVDVVAYLQPRPVSTREGRVIPLLRPFRTFDTRQAEFGASTLGAGQAETWSLACFVADVRIDGRWVGAQGAVLGNLTATGLEPRPDWPSWAPPVESYLTVFPARSDDDRLPTASNVNVRQGQSVANAALLRYGTSEVDGEDDPFSVRVFNNEGQIHYIFDAAAVVLSDESLTRPDCS